MHIATVFFSDFEVMVCMYVCILGTSLAKL